jgi:hypothetical protein
MIKQILITYSESSLPGGSNETSFSSLGLSWAKQWPFKDSKPIRQ